MPTMVLPRTPETERAYNIVDILKDLGKKVASQTLQGFTRPSTTTPKFTDEELMEMAFAPEAGMLKARGTSKLLAQTLKEMIRRRREIALPESAFTHKFFRTLSPAGEKAVDEAVSRQVRPMREAVIESLRVPEREWRPLEDVGFERLSAYSPAERRIAGRYSPTEERIALDPFEFRPGILFHEFAHTRQAHPQKLYTPEGLYEPHLASGLYKMWADLMHESQKIRGMTMDEFYDIVSPIERHARRVEELMPFQTGGRLSPPKSYGQIYQQALTEEVGVAERALESLLGKRAVEKVWLKAIGSPIYKYKGK